MTCEGNIVLWQRHQSLGLCRQVRTKPAECFWRQSSKHIAFHWSTLTPARPPISCSKVLWLSVTHLMYAELPGHCDLIHWEYLRLIVTGNWARLLISSWSPWLPQVCECWIMHHLPCDWLLVTSSLFRSAGDSQQAPPAWRGGSHPGPGNVMSGNLCVNWTQKCIALSKLVFSKSELQLFRKASFVFVNANERIPHKGRSSSALFVQLGCPTISETKSPFASDCRHKDSWLFYLAWVLHPERASLLCRADYKCKLNNGAIFRKD